MHIFKLLGAMALCALPLTAGCDNIAKRTKVTGKEVESIPRMGAVITEARKSVVEVFCDGPAGDTPAGSGYIVSPSGIVLTNWHVVTDRKRCKVRLLGEDQPVDTINVGMWEENDAAALYITDRLHKAPFPTLYLAPSPPSVGDTVASLGFPGRSGSSYVVSKVLKLSVVATDTTGHTHADMIDLSEELGGGSSGGPVIDTKGRVVGMNTLGSAGGGTATVTSVTQLRVMLKYARLYAHDTTPFAGVSADYREPVAGTPSRGMAHVTFVDSGSIADKVGLLTNDDVVAIDGNPVTANDDLEKRIDGMQAGQTLKLDVLRAGDEIDIDIVRPAEPVKESSGTSPRRRARRGKR